MYLLSTQEHTIPSCVKILQILIQLIRTILFLDWRKWPFLRFFDFLCKYHCVKSTQYKRLAPNALRFTYQNLKSCKSHKKYETLSFQFFTNRFSILMFFISFFHFICRISNSDKWAAKHLAQVSCTEFTLSKSSVCNEVMSMLLYCEQKVISLF